MLQNTLLRELCVYNQARFRMPAPITTATRRNAMISSGHLFPDGNPDRSCYRSDRSVLRLLKVYPYAPGEARYSFNREWRRPRSPSELIRKCKHPVLNPAPSRSEPKVQPSELTRWLKTKKTSNILLTL